MIFLLSSIARFCMFSPNHLVPACCLLSLTHSTTLPSYHSWSSLTLTLLPSYVHCNLTCLPACLPIHLFDCLLTCPAIPTYLPIQPTIKVHACTISFQYRLSIWGREGNITLTVSKSSFLNIPASFNAYLHALLPDFLLAISV